ncbi:HAD family phosphatase [Candidatus Roizmanbacteria bacterium]|nr:HAD family phosphatase [Candidatus Roizmanbacteria bacterium]
MAKAVIFDKDGVIVETTRLHFEKWKRTFAAYKKNITLDFMIRNLSGRSAKENIKRHLDASISQENLTKILTDQMSFMQKMFDKYAELVPGIIDFLKKLKKQKITTALATSSRKESTDLVLDRFKIRPYFQTIINANDILHAKPHPEIYLKSAQKLKVKPYQCVVFEDSYSGVEAAKKAGMKIVLVMTSHTQKEIRNVDLAIKDFTKISVADLKVI